MQKVILSAVMCSAAILFLSCPYVSYAQTDGEWILTEDGIIFIEQSEEQPLQQSVRTEPVVQPVPPILQNGDVRTNQQDATSLVEQAEPRLQTDVSTQSQIPAQFQTKPQFQPIPPYNEYNIAPMYEKSVNYTNNNPYISIKVPVNYPISVVTLQNVDSETLSNGDKISIRPASDIYMSGKLIFSKNAEGYAIVKSVKPARKLGKYGYIIIKEGFLPDVTGTLRPIKFDMKIDGERCQWAGIIGHAMIWNPIGWGVGLKKGTPAVIPAGENISGKNKTLFSI